MEFLLCAAQIDAHRAYEMGLVNADVTYQYLAPERLGKSPDDARADIYALQCVLYECLTGAPPFAGQTMAGLVAPHSSTSPPQPSIAKPGVPNGSTRSSPPAWPNTLNAATPPPSNWPPQCKTGAAPAGFRSGSGSAGGTTSSDVPFTGLKDPAHVAIGTDNTVYVISYDDGRVIKLTAGPTP
jgi:serine/threonine protein kinase